MAFLPPPPTIPIIQTFANKSYSSVYYPASVKAILGDYPSVQVMYWDKTYHVYVMANLPSTRVTFKGDWIDIDHGGDTSGIIRVI